MKIFLTMPIYKHSDTNITSVTGSFLDGKNQKGEWVGVFVVWSAALLALVVCFVRLGWI